MNLSAPVAPFPEQHIICDYIERQSKQIDGLIAKNTAQIDKLTEYRQTLISAAVTGKIDVQKQLPEVSSDAR